MATPTWNPSDKATAITLSNGDLTATATDNNVRSVRATQFIRSGDKRYWSVTVGAGSSHKIGLANQLMAISTGSITQTTDGIGYQNNGVVAQGGATITTIESYATGDVIHIAVDYSNGRIWFKKNSGNWNNSGTADPTTNTGGISIGFSGDIYPAVSLGVNTTAVTVNFTSASGAPSGFSIFPDSTLVSATGTGNFVIPAGVSSITAELWGGGGSSFSGGASCDGGGQGGGYLKIEIPVTPGDTIYWDVAAGTSDGTGSQPTKLRLNSSTFDNHYWSIANSGGAVGTPTGTQISNFSGGAGTAAQGGGGSRAGSGGGGAAGPQGAGNQGTAGAGSTLGSGGAADGGNRGGGAPAGESHVDGGAGGAGGAGGGGAGVDGGVPGGGAGGGGSSSGANGTGGRGQVRYSFIATPASILSLARDFYAPMRPHLCR